MKGFVNSNCFKEVLYVVKSSYQASPRPNPKKIIKKYKKLMIIKRVRDST